MLLDVYVKLPTEAADLLFIIIPQFGVKINFLSKKLPRPEWPGLVFKNGLRSPFWRFISDVVVFGPRTQPLPV